LLKPVTCTDVTVILPVSITIEEKLAFVDTWTLYDDAPFTAFQLSVGLVETPVVPSGGAESMGAPGNAAIVLKLHVAEKRPGPPAFDALTLQ
jgi:hypothetical protein